MHASDIRKKKIVITLLICAAFFGSALVATAYFEGWMRDSGRVPQRILLYYYDPSADVGPDGKSACSKHGLVGVERVVMGTNVIEESVRAVLVGDLTQPERDAGITTEFPLRGFILADANLSDGVLTLTFADPFNATSGEECKNRLLRLQIEETAKQFEAVDEVRFIPDDLFAA